jgi:hypothetical protein
MTMTIPSQFLFEAGLQSQKIAEEQEESKDKNRDNIYYEPDFCQLSDDGKQVFAAGQLVSHKKFGLGRVKEFHNLGDNSIIVVQFKSGHVKPLMLKYADLNVIE